MAVFDGDQTMLANAVTDSPLPAIDRDRNRSLHLSSIPEEDADRQSAVSPSPSSLSCLSSLYSPRSPLSATPSSSGTTAGLPPPPPPWDRTCDAGFGRQAPPEHAGPLQLRAETWQQSLVMLHSRFGRAYKESHKRPASPCRLLRLPDAVRYQIYTHLLSSFGHRPVRMNAPVFTRAVWPEDAFDGFADVLVPLEGALAASFDLRAEVLATVFSTYRFHVVFSPFVRPAVSPLATLYLCAYGCLLQHLTLELDCTRLGYGKHPAAAGLQPGMLSMDALVSAFVASQVAGRQQQQPARDTQVQAPFHLTVLCRRYYGNRPGVAATDAPGPAHRAQVPYVGPEVDRVAGHLGQLAGLVGSVRFVGFSDDFTERMLNVLGAGAMFSSSQSSHLPKTHGWRRSPSNMYPLLPGHRAYVDCGPELGICLSTRSSLAPFVCDAAESSPVPPSPLLSLSSPPSTHAHRPSSLAALLTTATSRPWLEIKVRPKQSRNRQRRPSILALPGIFRRPSSSSIAARLATAGLAVGAVDLPLRLLPSLASSSSSTASSYGDDGGMEALASVGRNFSPYFGAAGDKPGAIGGEVWIVGVAAGGSVRPRKLQKRRRAGSRASAASVW